MVVLSPHFDDAIFSLGQHLIDWIKQGKKIKVINVFTKKIDKGRESNDRDIMVFLGLETENWGLVDGASRIGWNKLLSGEILNQDKKTLSYLEKKIMDIGADVIVAPRGVGGHIDHVLVREAAKKIKNNKVIYYVESPYLWSNIGWFGRVKSFKLASKEKIRLAKIYGKEYQKVIRKWVRLAVEIIVDY